MFVPTFGGALNWNYDEEATFNINNFCLNGDLFFGLLSLMKEKNNWKISELPTNILAL